MRIQKALLLQLALCLIFIMCSCREKPHQDLVEEFYQEYADLLAYDVETALTDYVHYEDPLLYEIGIQTSNITIPEYNILSIEELSNTLWAIHVWQKDLIGSDYTIYQFVGVINGEYKVILNPDNIPSYLKTDVDLTPYYSENNVSPNDIIAEITP